MATARIKVIYPDDTIVHLEVDSGDDASHPDILDELVSRVLTLYRETVGIEEVEQ